MDGVHHLIRQKMYSLCTQTNKKRRPEESNLRNRFEDTGVAESKSWNSQNRGIGPLLTAQGAEGQVSRQGNSIFSNLQQLRELTTNKYNK
jgi:hypothetical protein